MSNMWTAPEDDPRTYGSPDSEKENYRDYLSNVVKDAFTAWKAEIAAADEWFDTLTDEDPSRDDTGDVRDVLLHVIEEYARHAGHADLLRECIDGRNGQ